MFLKLELRLETGDLREDAGFEAINRIAFGECLSRMHHMSPMIGRQMPPIKHSWAFTFSASLTFLNRLTRIGRDCRDGSLSLIYRTLRSTCLQKETNHSEVAIVLDEYGKFVDLHWLSLWWLISRLALTVISFVGIDSFEPLRTNFGGNTAIATNWRTHIKEDLQSETVDLFTSGCLENSGQILGRFKETAVVAAFFYFKNYLGHTHVLGGALERTECSLTELALVYLRKFRAI